MSMVPSWFLVLCTSSEVDIKFPTFLCSEGSKLELDWSTRRKICIEVARGLAYLHEESPLKIVHRDIKATNILLDKDMNAKISDFGLAKLDEEENSHISTRIAGTRQAGFYFFCCILLLFYSSMLF